MNEDNFDLLRETEALFRTAGAHDLADAVGKINQAKTTMIVGVVGTEVPTELKTVLIGEGENEPQVRSLAELTAKATEAVLASQLLLVIPYGVLLDAATLEAIEWLTAARPHGSTAVVLINAAVATDDETLQRVERQAWRCFVAAPPSDSTPARLADYFVFLWGATVKEGQLAERLRADGSALAAWLRQPSPFAAEQVKASLLALLAILEDRLRKDEKTDAVATSIVGADASPERMFRDAVQRLRTRLSDRIDGVFTTIERGLEVDARGLQHDLVGRLSGLLKTPPGGIEVLRAKIAELLDDARQTWVKDSQTLIGSALTDLGASIADEIGGLPDIGKSSGTDVRKALALDRRRSTLIARISDPLASSLDQRMLGDNTVIEGAARDPSTLSQLASHPETVLGAILGGALSLAATVAAPVVMPTLFPALMAFRPLVIGLGIGLGAVAGGTHGWKQLEATRETSQTEIDRRTRLALDRAFGAVQRAVNDERREIKRILASELDRLAAISPEVTSAAPVTSTPALAIEDVSGQVARLRARLMAAT